MDQRKRLPAMASCMAFLFVLVAAATAWAFIGAEQNEMYEIPLQEFDLFSYRSPAVELARTEAAQNFTRSGGGSWSVYSWNPQSNTPSNIIGSGIQITSGEFLSEREVVATAESVIQAHPGVFKADLENLRLHNAPRGLGKWAVHFQQTYHGMDVWGARVHLVFTDGGRLFAFGSDYYTDINVNPRPSIPASVAWDIAARDLPVSLDARFSEDEADLLILPEPISETQVEHRLVWRVRVPTEEPIGIWVTHVDAHSGRIIWRYNDVHFNFIGTTAGGVQRFSYCDPEQEEPLPYLRVQVSGVGNVYADVDGNWTVNYGGSTPQTVTATLYSPYVDVRRNSGTPGTFTGTAYPGVPFEVRFDGANSWNDERDVYQTINDVHTFFLDFAPGFGYINQRITGYVRRPGSCNAYYNGTINFYAEGGGCGNTGQMMDVIAHEFGHGIQAAILGWQGDQGLGEGNSDFTGSIITMDSVMGNGFYLNQCATGIRDCNNTLQYPQDVIGIPIHSAGRVICGFHWDAMMLLIDEYGEEQGRLRAAETWHFGRVLMQPTTQPAQVLATFIADDNDGDLSNGTPNYSAYCQGAMNHGFDCPEITVGVRIEHSPIYTSEDSGDKTALAIIYSTVTNIDDERVEICYEINGLSQGCHLMTPTGNVNEYQGIIPSVSSPSEVSYYLSAWDDDNNHKTSPDLAPTVQHQFDVATAFDPMEAASGWVVNLEGTDDAATGIWERVIPVGTWNSGQPVQPDHDHTPWGEYCWVTGQHLQGQGVGYNDVDDGTTSLFSPVYDLTSATSAKVKYYRWYSNNLGGNPGIDWWVVQVRNNGGSWVDIERTQQSANSWNLVEADLLAIFGSSIGNVQLRFQASDMPGQGSLVEAAVDDFAILASLGASDVSEGLDAGLRYALFPGQPNPTVGQSSIRFQIPAETRVQLRIFDVTGRQVKTLADGQFDAGTHTLDWDGRDASGRPVASGVYFYRMQAGGFEATRTLTVAR